eukprot:199429_1
MPSSDKRYVSCLGITVPCENGGTDQEECPLLSLIEFDVQQYVCDKDYDIATFDEFKLKQENGLFKPNNHYWFQVREDGVRYIAPYADDVVDFFQDHYYIDNIGHSSMLTLEEFVSSYNKDNPGKYVLYAGTWKTDENGRIIYWSNDAGHYLPSIDYAAPVAEALGITNAIFVAWYKNDQDYSIFYRQYQDYTGAFHAKMQIANLIADESQQQEEVFYPHNYHNWYKYHGNKGEFTQHLVGHHSHNNSYNGIGFLWAGLFIAVLCCMIGIIVSFVLPKNKKFKGNVYEKNVSSDVSDENNNDENNEEYDDEIINM